jgi:protein YIPF6
MSLAVMLSLKAHEEASLVFSVIFVIVWVGAAVVTINGQLLGGRLSFFQSVCLLGYCVFPILLSAGACFAYNSLVAHEVAVVLRFVTVVIALFWSIFGTSTTYDPSSVAGFRF